MKDTTGYAQPRRLTKPKKQVRLHLRQRRAQPEPEGEIEIQPKNTFWKWVGIVALLHLALIIFVSIYYEFTPTPPPPETVISLLPQGTVVKGTPGPTEAPKLGVTTPAPSVAHHHHAEATPPKPMPTPTAITKPAPTPAPAEPLVKSDAPALVPDKPAPAKPAPPKVKVDLTLQDGPTPVKHTKPKHIKKPTPPAETDDSNAPDRDAPSNPDSTGLSKEQIAQKLGEKLQAAGVTTAVNPGTSGSDHGQENPFQDFYLSVRDQVMNKWTSPNLTDETAINPEVTIHVEKDGRVPPEQVTLTRSSGNQAYDDSAVAAAKSLGYLLQPLPEGCPPDIHINFKLNR